MEIELVSIDNLKLWESNPRSIGKKEFENLKKRLIEAPDQNNKQFKPLIVNQDNIVLGGNMRLRAMRDLGWEQAGVVRVKTSSKKDMLWYALTDNEKSGWYDDDVLAELTVDFPEFADFKIDLGKSVDLGHLLDKYRPSDNNDKVNDECVCAACGHIHKRMV